MIGLPTNVLRCLGSIHAPAHRIHEYERTQPDPNSFERAASFLPITTLIEPDRLNSTKGGAA